MKVTQLLDLLLLSLDPQDQVLHLEVVDGVEPLSEWALRAVAHAGNWAQQRAAWPPPEVAQSQGTHAEP